MSFPSAGFKERLGDPLSSGHMRDYTLSTFNTEAVGFPRVISPSGGSTG